MHIPLKTAIDYDSNPPLEVTQKQPLAKRNFEFSGRQPTAIMYSTQLCIVYRWLKAAKLYFISLQKNWEPISFT
jgi:hypothetical protein